ncbi:MAG: ribonuclease P protein component [Cyanobacteria bacterium P01_H01_bin.119]
MALPKPYRLRHRHDFAKVYRAGERAGNHYMVVRALQISGENKSGPTRLGISVSQKVSKRAVVRNRLKRQIGAAFQQLIPDLKPGWWLVVGVRPAAVECEYGQFLQELKKILKKLEVINGR